MAVTGVMIVILFAQMSLVFVFVHKNLHDWVMMDVTAVMAVTSCDPSYSYDGLAVMVITVVKLLVEVCRRHRTGHDCDGHLGFLRFGFHRLQLHQSSPVR